MVMYLFTVLYLTGYKKESYGQAMLSLHFKLESTYVNLSPTAHKLTTQAGFENCLKYKNLKKCYDVEIIGHT